MRNRFGDYNKVFFSSQKEYDDYCWCLSKIALGDTVSIYIVEDGHYVGSFKSSRTIDAVVIAMDKCLPRKFVIANKNECLSFWCIGDDLHNVHFYEKECIKNIREYQYAWAVRSVADARIAKITKNNI